MGLCIILHVGYLSWIYMQWYYFTISLKQTGTVFFIGAWIGYLCAGYIEF